MARRRKKRDEEAVKLLRALQESSRELKMIEVHIFVEGVCEWLEGHFKKLMEKDG